MTDQQKAIFDVLCDIRDLLARPVLKKISILPAANITLSTTAVSIMSAYNVSSTNSRWFRGYVESVAIKVQNMGTATKVNFGDNTGVIDTLTAAKDAVEFEAPLDRYLDLSDIWLSVDAGTTTIVEISGLFYPWNTVSPPVQPQRVK